MEEGEHDVSDIQKFLNSDNIGDFVNRDDIHMDENLTKFKGEDSSLRKRNIDVVKGGSKCNCGKGNCRCNSSCRCGG